MRALPWKVWLSGSALLALALAACPGPKPSPDGGTPDAGSGPKYCGAEGSPCQGNADCCGHNLTCQSGSCQPSSPVACSTYGGLCGSGGPSCCVTRPPDGGWPDGSVPPVLGCFVPDAGSAVCIMGVQPGDPCGVGLWGCTNGLTCIKGSCQTPPPTHVACPRADGGCEVGDDCSSFAQAFFQNCSPTANSDPCIESGLDCVQTAAQAQSCNDTGFTCQEPSVIAPPNFPLVQAPQAYSLCSDQSACQPIPGDVAAPVCGSFFVANPTAIGITAQPTQVCVEACQTGDDCGSLAWDCVSGVCVPNYCYAEPDSQGDDIAASLSQGQPNAPVSDKLAVLFQPCAHGGPNTVCLPENDNNWNTTVGVCYRVGDATGGGPGASCDPSGARDDPAGLCQSGNLCFKGTCLPWCDTGNASVASCASGQSCVAIGGALVSSTANDNGTGVCTEGCDPYVTAAANGCPVGHDGQPPWVCKPSGTDNDVFPSPGVCVGGRESPIAVGQGCDPYGWVDPCVSGAVCTLNQTADGGTGYPGVASQFVCAQICDPSPSPNFTVPPGSCPGTTTCEPLGPPLCQNDNNANFTCTHVGACL